MSYDSSAGGIAESPVLALGAVPETASELGSNVGAIRPKRGKNRRTAQPIWDLAPKNTNRPVARLRSTRSVSGYGLCKEGFVD